MLSSNDICQENVKKCWRIIEIKGLQNLTNCDNILSEINLDLILRRVGIVHSSVLLKKYRVLRERKKMAKVKVKDLVEELVTPFLEENGMELYNVEFVKEAKDWFLRIYIDKQESPEETFISTDDCELVSRFLSEKLDENDPIEQNYYLEVSSPGMDRVLLKEKDYVRYAGKQVDVNLYQAVNGKKTLTGELVGIVDNQLVINDETGRVEIPMEKVAKTRLAVIF